MKNLTKQKLSDALFIVFATATVFLLSSCSKKDENKEQVQVKQTLEQKKRSISALITQVTSYPVLVNRVQKISESQEEFDALMRSLAERRAVIDDESTLVYKYNITKKLVDNYATKEQQEKFIERACKHNAKIYRKIERELHKSFSHSQKKEVNAELRAQIMFNCKNLRKYFFKDMSVLQYFELSDLAGIKLSKQEVLEFFTRGSKKKGAFHEFRFQMLFHANIEPAIYTDVATQTVFKNTLTRKMNSVAKKELYCLLLNDRYNAAAFAKAAKSNPSQTRRILKYLGEATCYAAKIQNKEELYAKLIINISKADATFAQKYNVGCTEDAYEMLLNLNFKNMEFLKLLHANKACKSFIKKKRILEKADKFDCYEEGSRMPFGLKWTDEKIHEVYGHLVKTCGGQDE
jgi:hypothetical protein